MIRINEPHAHAVLAQKSYSFDADTLLLLAGRYYWIFTYITLQSLRWILVSLQTVVSLTVVSAFVPDSLPSVTLWLMQPQTCE